MVRRVFKVYESQMDWARMVDLDFSQPLGASGRTTLPIVLLGLLDLSRGYRVYQEQKRYVDVWTVTSGPSGEGTTGTVE